MKFRLFSLLSLLVFTANCSFGGVDKINPDKIWDANWVCTANSAPNEYGVYHFRKTFDLDAIPEKFVLDISADNRYRLFVNGKSVCFGPARGDINSWYYETVDIAPYLKTGKNVIAAEVWNGGDASPAAQITKRTALIVQGHDEARFIGTPKGWKSVKSGAYGVNHVPGFTYAGHGESIDGRKLLWGWNEMDFDDSAWQNVAVMGKGRGYGNTARGEVDWALEPRTIPLMEETLLRLQKVLRAEGVENAGNFIAEGESFTIPANTKCSVLIDQGHLTTAFPFIATSGGKDAVVKIKYAEALVDQNQQKGDRAAVDGYDIPNYCFTDSLVLDGAANRLYRPTWFKTYRYVKLEIETKEEPLTIDDFYGMYTGYPFQENGSFESDDPELGKIWEAGWRTARLCAHETYYDCPFYEQLQYLGDTRIQALISLYVSGDDRLMRKAIRDFDLSRSYEGLTSSRYPSHVQQYIPPFSLYWVNIVRDFQKHREDDAFVGNFLFGIDGVLNWYLKHIDEETGMLKPDMPYWNFVDWVNEKGWHDGRPPESDKSASATITLQLAAALRDAADIMQKQGKTAKADEYRKMHRLVADSVYKNCWDAERGLLRDAIGAETYSQHANVMGIITDAIPAEQQAEVFNRVMTETDLAQCTFYYRFYLFRAMKKVGMADMYVEALKPWRDMLAINLTTFAENPEPSRSDCHAWSASPNYDLLATVCGIEPDSEGFATVKIEPAFGSLNRIEGSLPHPKGDIKAAFEKTENGGIKGKINLPEGLSGRFVWKGVETKLSDGETEISQ